MLPRAIFLILPALMAACLWAAPRCRAQGNKISAAPDPAQALKDSATLSRRMDQTPGSAGTPATAAVAVRGFSGAQARAAAAWPAQPLYKNPFAQRPQEYTEQTEKKTLTKIKEMFPLLEGLGEEKEDLRSVNLVVEDIKDESIAMQMDGKITLSREALRRSFKSLAEDGIPPDEIPEILAAHYLSVMAHELRHNVNFRNLPGRANSIEEEMSGARAEIAGIKAAQKAFPEAFRYKSLISSDSQALWNFWRSQGPEVLRTLVIQNYKNLPSIYNDSDIDIQRRQESNSYFLAADLVEREIKNYDDAMARCRGSRLPEFCKMRLGLSGGFEGWFKKKTRMDFSNRQDAIADVQIFRQTANFWLDEKQLVNAKKYYEGERCRAWKQWCLDFPQGCLKDRSLPCK